MERIAEGENFARFRLGSIQLTALRDGHVDMPTTRLRNAGQELTAPELHRQVPLHAGQLRLSVNAFLVETPAGLVLVDTGAANVWEPTMGRLPQALRGAGVAPDRIRTVAFTHTHVDHINGLVLPDGSDAFPNLRHLWVPEPELSLFHREARLARFHSRAAPFVWGQLLGGVLEAVEASGHEMGHTCFRVTEEAGEILIWGDTVHVPAIQFERPEITWEFDAVQKAACASRMRLFEHAVRDKTWVAGSHLDWPGVGKVARREVGFEFLPL